MVEIIRSVMEKYIIVRARRAEDFKTGKYQVKEFDINDRVGIVKYTSGYIYFVFRRMDEVERFLDGIKGYKKKRRLGRIYRREVFVSDLQIPFQDVNAVEVFFDIARDLKPDIVYLGGDIIDFYSISPFLKDAEFVDVRYEVQKLVQFLIRVRNEFPKAKIYYHQGNHEMRLFRELWKSFNGALTKVSNYLMHPVYLFQLDGLGIEYVDEPIRIGRLYHLHGHEAKSRGRIEHVALNLLRRWGENLICGHFHKFDEFVIKALDGTLKAAYINGCLFDIMITPKPSYEPYDVGQKGFSFIVYDDDGFFDVEQIIFIEEKIDGVDRKPTKGVGISKLFGTVRYKVFVNNKVLVY